MIIGEAVQFGPPEDRRQDLLAWYRLVDDRPWYVDRALVLVELKKPAVPEKTWALVIAVRNPKVEPPSKQTTRWHTPRHYHGEPFGVAWYPVCPTPAEVDAFLNARTVDFAFGAPASGFRFIDNGLGEDAWRARFGTEMPYAFAR